jgi:hypothetical protein
MIEVAILVPHFVPSKEGASKMKGGGVRRKSNFREGLDTG